MPAFPALRSPIPPVPSWGSGLFEGHDAVFLEASGKVADLERVLGPLFDLSSELTAGHSAGVAMNVNDASDGFPKTRQPDMAYCFDPASVIRWAERDVGSNAALNVEGLRVFFFRHGSSDLALEWLLSDTSLEAADAAIEVLVHLSEFAGWTGYVGLGSGWSQYHAIGYGPAVLRPIGDVDLELSSELVQLKYCDGDRLLLRCGLGADLVDGVREIRRLCAPGLGYGVANMAMNSGSLCFEGEAAVFSPRGFRHPDFVIQGEVLEALGVHQRGWGVDKIVAPQRITVSGWSPLRDGADDLERLLAAWRRGATAASPGEHLGPDGWFQMQVITEGDVVRIETGHVSAGALEALRFGFEQWPRLFPSEPPAALEIAPLRG